MFDFNLVRWYNKPALALGGSLGPFVQRGGEAAVREYELMVIYSPQLDEEALTAQIERTKELIVGVGGEVEKVDQWGKRRFAYEIKKNTEGFYVVIDFKAESGATSEVERILKITDEVVRYLLVRRDVE